MITFKELYDYIDSHVACVNFKYHGQQCGIDPFSDTEIDIWYGDKAETMTSVDDVFHSPFFDGKSLTEIFPEIAQTIPW